jgi:hypothetical protein
MPREKARLADFQQVAPLAVGRIKKEGPKKDAVCLRNPDTRVIGNGFGHDFKLGIGRQRNGARGGKLNSGRHFNAPLFAFLQNSIQNPIRLIAS